MKKTKKKIFEEIIHRFAEAIHYKITRDILLYGVCVLEEGNTDDLDEITEIRKRLDEVNIMTAKDMIKEIKIFGKIIL